MAKHVCSVPMQSKTFEKVFALVHPGGLLATPVTVLYLALEGAQDAEVRIRISRHASKASGGDEQPSSPLSDGAAAAKCKILTGNVSWPLDAPSLSAPDRCCTRGQRSSGWVLDGGSFTLAPNHTLVVETLDRVLSADTYPLTFVIGWDE